MSPLISRQTRDVNRTAWADPGVETVAPGVTRIPLPLPNDALRAVNVYALTNGDGVVLIDGGWAQPEAEERLSAGLATIGAEAGDVLRVLVTHIHRDHYTLAVALRQKYGTQVALGVGERPSMRLVQAGAGGEGSLDRLRACGEPELADQLERHRRTDPDDLVLWSSPDVWLGEGPEGDDVARQEDVRVGERSLLTVPTPGHTAGHVVFRDDAAGLLFSGDHVLPHITPSIGFVPDPGLLPLRDFLDSLRLVRSMPDTVLLPAHGPVAPSVHARVDELVEHHDRRLEATSAAVAAGAVTASEAAARLTWTRRERRLEEMDPFNRMLAVLETGAHLDLLVASARLQSAVENGVVCYRLA